MRANQSGQCLTPLPAADPGPNTDRQRLALHGASRVRSILLRLLWLVVLFRGLTPVQATPPVNDLCAGAEVIPSNAAFPYSTAVTDITDATTNADPPMASCAFGNAFSHSIWYTFTPAGNAFYTISTCADAPTLTTVADTFMAIYVSSSGGCGGIMTEIPSSASSSGCADDSCGPGFTQAAITTQLLADTTYFIVVWQYGTAAPPVGSSKVQLNISKTSPPDNDSRSGATEVFLNLPLLGTTILAQDDYELPAAATCFSGIGQKASTGTGRDVVYSFTAPESGNFSIKANNYKTSCWDKNGGCYDLVLYAASALPDGPPPALVTACLAGANRNPASSAEEILCLPLTNGQQIYIIVDEDVFSTEGSSFTLEVTKCIGETEPDNTWSNAGPLACGMEGSIQPASDVDYYSLGIPPAGSRVFAMLDGSAANVTGFQMRVIAISPTSTNTLEFDNGNNDVLFGELSPNVAGTALTGAPAFLRITGVGQQEEPYRLYAVVQPPLSSATLETEPNNTPAQARRIL